MENSRYTIFGLSKWETKFEISWIQWETSLQYLAYLSGINMWDSMGKEGESGTHFNGKFQV